MDTLDPQAIALAIEALYKLGPAGLTMALVATLRRRLQLSRRATVTAAGVCAVLVSLAVDWSDGSISIHRLPLDSLVSALLAMGAFSGVKNGMGK
jgi:hypothetical protein